MIKTYPIICASVAGNPSTLGVKMHNAGYAAAGLDYTYVAMGAENAEEAIRALTLLGYRGMGVSMPFKESIIQYLDVVDDSVKVIGACNTIVNTDKGLVGYNTDWIGAQNALREVIDISKIDSAVIVGAGGVARAIAYALKFNGIKVYIAARNKEQREKLTEELQLDDCMDLNEQGKFDVDLVVNATPDASKNGPVKLPEHKKVSVVFDVVFNQYMTDLTREAKEKGLKYVSGWRMLLLQGAKQFELYTSMDAPLDAMGQVLLDWLNA